MVIMRKNIGIQVYQECLQFKMIYSENIQESADPTEVLPDQLDSMPPMKFIQNMEMGTHHWKLYVIVVYDRFRVPNEYLIWYPPESSLDHVFSRFPVMTAIKYYLDHPDQKYSELQVEEEKEHRLHVDRVYHYFKQGGNTSGQRQPIQAVGDSSQCQTCGSHVE